MKKIEIAKVNKGLKNNKNMNLKRILTTILTIGLTSDNLGHEQIANVKLIDPRRDAKRSNQYFWQI